MLEIIANQLDHLPQQFYPVDRERCNCIYHSLNATGTQSEDHQRV